MAAVPSIATAGLNTDNSAAPPTPHMLSGRRLSKSVMTADSQNTDASKGWGLVALHDGSGTARAVRVVQKAEAEDFNMMKVTWAFTLPGDTTIQQVELRHGRRSGIRKISVNKELIDREKSLKNLISDSGGRKTFMIGRQGAEREAEILIHPKGLSGFTYQLLIDGNPIEQQMTISGTDDPLNGLDIGVRAVQLPKTADGLGMTLRNNPLGATGVVVWTVEAGKAAANAGIQIGDCVLSIESHIVSNIDKLVEYVSESVGVVNMELAGALAPPSLASHAPHARRALAGLCRASHSGRVIVCWCLGSR